MNFHTASFLCIIFLSNVFYGDLGHNQIRFSKNENIEISFIGLKQNI